MVPEEELFTLERERLRGLAYRMTGSVADAEDVVQDAWLRWQACDQSAVKKPRTFITRIVSNLSLDRLRTNKRQRETYIGPWLPEPCLENFRVDETTNPEHAQQLADDISVAFMLTLEVLSPAERAAFILHDVFAYQFSELAELLDRSPTSCRQLASRARKALKENKPRFTAEPEAGKKLANAFQKAIQDGNLAELTQLLSANTTFISDGGGKVTAVPAPVIGAEKVAKLLLGFANLYRGKQNLQSKFTTINGLPAFILWQDAEPLQTVSLEIGTNGLIDKIYVVRNPGKLRHLKQK